MEGGSFFAGLLKGFGGGLQQAEAKKAQEDLQRRQIIGNILVGALEADPSAETWGAIGPMLGQLYGVSAESLGIAGKGSKSPLAALFDPQRTAEIGSARELAEAWRQAVLAKGGFVSVE